MPDSSTNHAQVSDAIGTLSQRYLRACRSCALAKSKCVGRQKNNDRTRCERCSRMDLDCAAQAPVMRKRRPVKALGVGQLEQKLDNIVTLLSQSQAGLQSSTRRHISPDPSLLWIRDPAESNSIYAGAPVSRPVVRHSVEDQGVGPPVSSLNQGFDSYSPLRMDMSSEEEEARLRIFRTQMVKDFPFVVVSASTSAQNLRVERPFLYATIMLATSSRDKLSRKLRVQRALMEYVSIHVLVNGERNIDLLQGMLVYLSSCNHLYRNNPQISNLIQLAIAMAVELGLNKAPLSSPGRQPDSVDEVPYCEGPAKLDFHSSDAMRALAGCFYLSSVISSSFKKLEAMSYTPYIERCCTSLAETIEFPTDLLLSYLVRLQYFVRNIHHTLPTNNLDASWSPNTPVAMYVKLIAEELQQFKDSTSLEGQLTAHFLTHYHSVEILLCENNLCESPSTSLTQSFPRIELLYTCLRSLKSYLDAFFLIPANSYFTLSIVTWVELARVLAVLGRLLLANIKGWDLIRVREEIDFPILLDQLSQKFADAGKEGDVLEDENHFLQYARMMQWAKSSYNTNLTLDSTRTPPATDHLAYDLFPEQFPGFDDLFWQECVGEMGISTL